MGSRILSRSFNVEKWDGEDDDTDADDDESKEQHSTDMDVDEDPSVQKRHPEIPGISRVYLKVHAGPIVLYRTTGGNDPERTPVPLEALAR